MRQKQLRFGKGFRIAIGNARAQAAEMVIPPGDCEGGPDNRHRGADQWLFVVSGRGAGIVNGRRKALREGSLLLIEKGDTHEIRNTGRTPLKTVNIYVPPAYRSDGEELPRGRKWMKHLDTAVYAQSDTRLTGAFIRWIRQDDSQ
jgi:mannose-6-phosphate isomerase-like protein (cupin superfamily)